MNRLCLRSYFIFDGIPSFRDSQLLTFYDRICAEGSLPAMNYEGKLSGAREFLAAVKSAFYFADVHFNDRSVALVWLNRFENRRAHIHFCIWKCARGRQMLEFGPLILSALLDLRDRQHGECILDCLWGVVPAVNRSAISSMFI